MYFIGDVHREWKAYRWITERMQLKGGKKGMDCSLVVGDMGIGFRDNSDDSVDGKSFILDISLQHKFIVGNHDDRALSYNHPNCVGDYGYHEHSGIFYISGGFSIDWQWREKNHNWWDNEELSPGQMSTALKLYEQTKPNIVIAHECPTEIKNHVITNPAKGEIISRTEALLQKMIEIHRPNYFIFGHHHKKWEEEIKGIYYVCLDTLSFGKYSDCIFEIPEITWE